MFGIRTKLFGAFGAIVLVLLVVSFLADRVFDRYTAETRRAVHDDLDSVIAARDMRDAVDTMSEAARESDLTGKVPDAKLIATASSDFVRAMNTQQQISTLPDEELLTKRIQQSWETILKSMDVYRTSDATTRSHVDQNQLSPAVREARMLLTRLAKLNSDSIISTNGQLQMHVTASQTALHILSAVGVLLAVGIAWVSSHHIIEPLNALIKSANAIARGDFDQKLSVSSSDELGQLCISIIHMAAELKRFRALDADRLLRSYQATQTAIDSLPDGVVLLNELGQVELANQTATRLFGIKAGDTDLKSRSPRLASAIEQPAPAFDSFRPSIEIGDAGQIRHFLPQSIPLKNIDDKTIGMTLILTDVTDFRRLDNLKDSLLSTASHELKTPLTSMRMILPLLLEQKDEGLNDSQIRLLTVVNEQVERLHRIVETILDMGRLASGNFPIDLSPAQPCELAAAAIASQKAAYDQNLVELINDVPDNLPAVLVDKVRLPHVFANLLDNARRFTSPGRKVVIHASATADAIKFSISDTGAGIPPEELPRLFESFYRVPGQGGDTGSGLGLAIVKQIVEAHGGRVGVESDVGQGTTFTFTIPIQRKS